MYHAFVKFKKLGTYADAKQSGRSHRTTPRTDILIKRKVMNSLKCSAKKIRVDLNETSISVSRQTISHCLVEEFGLKLKKTCKKTEAYPKDPKEASSVCIAA